MRAEDAIKQTINSCNDQINEINEKIKEACRNGKNQIILRDDIEDGTRLYLLEAGYIYQRGQNVDLIIWTNEQR